MDWWIQLLTILGGSSVISLITTIAYFKPKLKEVQAGAVQAEVAAEEKRSSFLEDRIKALETLNAKQGQMLDAVRSQLLELSAAKQKSDERILELEGENRSLKKELNTIKAQMKRAPYSAPQGRKGKAKPTKTGKEPAIQEVVSAAAEMAFQG